MRQKSHDKWDELHTSDVRRYIEKYLSADAPGKVSARRRKKISYFKAILKKREQAERLILGH